MNGKQKNFTLTELKEFDGRNGKPAYVAFKGRVYDVSGSRLWPDGGHRGRHVAGSDLTPGMINAPHDEAVLEKFPVVGEIGGESYRNRIQKTIERLHLHSMVVHFSVALALVLVLFAYIYLITGNASFEQASFYLLILLLAATPLSAISGFFSWVVTYEARRSRTFDRKIAFTIALTVVVTGCNIWRILVPDVLIERSVPSYFYALSLTALGGITAILGHYGGKIVFS
jgi:predicted heme/steroid binding protein/uncharacterized membrane protein